MTLRIPRALVGSLCLGFALANVARVPMAPALGAGSALAALGLAASGSRLRLVAASSLVVALAWTLCATIIGLPIGLWLIDQVPFATTLMRY